MSTKIRDLKTASSQIRAAALVLNNEHKNELSLLTAAKFDELVAAAFFAWYIGELDALLVTFEQSARYDSPNFLWFRERYESFVYIDRVVVAPSSRGRGLARQLYTALIEQARAAGHEWLFCEVNSDPPNVESDAFHASLGFKPVGESTADYRGKGVQFLGLRISDDP